MSIVTKIIIGFAVVIVLFVGGRFFYFNVIVPWPYRHELRACLDEARAQETEAAIAAAENVCFRTYPHFN